MTQIVLSDEQIKSLAEFAESEGHGSYTKSHATFPAFEADDGEVIPEYTGLVAYSGSGEHGVLQLDD